MLYSDVIRERWRRPRFRGRLERPDAIFEDVNPLCGDRIRMECRLSEGRVAEVRFSGDACAIAVASADVLIEMVTGQPFDVARAVDTGQVLERLGGEVRPSRRRCVTLPLSVLHGALEGRAVTP
jgi:NifU-like protein involved in Fe-S cluster formation